LAGGLSPVRAFYRAGFGWESVRRGVQSAGMSEGRKGREWVWVTAVLLLAAVTRLPGLSWAPPPINQDEASNGYDAYSLLETGKDRGGHAWPVILEALGRGDFRPALYAYLTIPFAAWLGPENLVVATRLPAALWGLLTIGLLYGAVRRVSDARTAVWAALLLVLSPWHLQLSRFGHEATLTPLFPIAVVLTLSLAGWPLRGVGSPEGNRVRLRWPWMAALGLVVGLSQHTYGSMKLFMPAFLLVGGVVYWRAWRPVLRDGRSRLGLALSVVVAGLVLAPLIHLYATQWSTVNARAMQESLFHKGMPVAQLISEIGGKYLRHCDPQWMFVRGDVVSVQSIPGVGQLNWYMLALLPVGLVGLARQWRAHRGAALLLEGLLLYPIAGSLTTSGPHALRSACGLGVLQWIGAIGIRTLAGTASAVGSKRRLAATAGVVAALAVNAWYTGRQYFVTEARAPFYQALFQADLCEALTVVRDRWRGYDRIFISDHVSAPRPYWPSIQPYVYPLLILPVPPAEFQSWEKTYHYRNEQDQFHTIDTMGPFVLSAAQPVLEEHFRTRAHARALFVVRPGDLEGGRLLHVIRGPGGEERFHLIEVAPPAGGPGSGE